MGKITSVLMIALVLLVTACAPQDADAGEADDGRAEYDLIEDDIVTLAAAENITSWNMSVRGVELNDTKDEVLNKLGGPDNFTRFEGEDLVIENFEYGEGWGLNQSGLIVHMENERVTKITVNDNFNQFLHNETKLNGSKRDVYFTLGSSDNNEILYKFILLQYHDEGLEFITFRGEEVGLSLVPPGDTNRTYNTSPGEKRYIPYQQEMRLT